VTVGLLPRGGTQRRRERNLERNYALPQQDPAERRTCARRVTLGAPSTSGLISPARGEGQVDLVRSQARAYNT
jgi:hypothetical protein